MSVREALSMGTKSSKTDPSHSIFHSADAHHWTQWPVLGKLLLLLSLTLLVLESWGLIQEGEVFFSSHSSDLMLKLF